MGQFFQRKQSDEVVKFDLKAPRVMNTYYSTLRDELYEEFKKKHPDSTVTKQDFKNIVKASNSAIAELVISHREGVDLPFGLGKLMIGSCEKKRDKNYNWLLSSKLGKAIEHKNWESNKYLCKIFYSKFETKYKFPLMGHWTFSPARTFQRKVSSAFKENWNMYIKVPKFQKISKANKEQGIKSIKIIKNEKKGSRMDFSDTQPI